MQYLSNVARWAAAAEEFCASSVAAGKNTTPASNTPNEVSGRVRIMRRSLPRATELYGSAGYTNAFLLTTVLLRNFCPCVLTGTHADVQPELVCWALCLRPMQRTSKIQG